MKQNTKAVPDLSAVAISTSSPANLEMRYRRLFETAQDGIVLIDAETGDGEFVSAGSESPLVLRGGASGTFEHIPIDDISLPLGINADETYRAVPLRLLPGDTLILMTDGITEARALRSDADAALDVLSASLPTELAKTLDPTQSPRDMAMAILEGARAFAAGALEDDACLLLARRRIEGNK